VVVLFLSGMLIMAYNMVKTIAGGRSVDDARGGARRSSRLTGEEKMKLTQDAIERNVGLMVVLTLLVVSVGGLVEIVPLFFQKSTTEPVTGLKPYDPVRLTGRDVYIREGCFLCHSQMIRPFRAETERYGHYSVAGEFVYDHPFQWGSKRTGPDLHRVGGRYSDEWHRAHLINPRDVVPESNMPAFAFLEKAPADANSIEAKMRALRKVGVPYTDDEIAGARKQLEGKSELDAVIAYLQGMGLEMKNAK
jgi:cytochrome c oxidase cbb3-type subunit 2